MAFEKKPDNEVMNYLKKGDKNLDGIPDLTQQMAAQLNKIEKNLQESINEPIAAKLDKGKKNSSFKVNRAAEAGTVANEPHRALLNSLSNAGIPLTQNIPKGIPAHLLGDVTNLPTKRMEGSGSIENPQDMWDVFGVPQPVLLSGRVNASTQRQIERRRQQEQATRQQQQSQQQALVAEEQENNRQREQQRQQSYQDWTQRRYGTKGPPSPLPPNPLGPFGFPPPPPAKPPKDILDQPFERGPGRPKDSGPLLAEELHHLDGGPLPLPYTPPAPVDQRDKRSTGRKFLDNLFGETAQRDQKRVHDAQDRMNQAESFLQHQNNELARLEENLRKASLDRDNGKLLGRSADEMKPLHAAVGLAKMDFDEKRKELPRHQRELDQAQKAFDRLKRKQEINQAGQGYGQASKLADTLGLGGLGQVLGHGHATAQAQAAGLPVPGGLGLASGGGQQALAGVGQMLSSQRLGGTVAGAGGVLSGAGLMTAGALGGPVGLAVGGTLATFGKLTSVVGDSVEKLRKWNDGLLEGNLKFAEFSAAMSLVAAKQMRDEIRLSQERGDRRAGAAMNQQSGRMALERTIAPYEDMASNVMSNISGAISAYLDVKIREIMSVAGPAYSIATLLMPNIAQDLANLAGMNNNPMGRNSPDQALQDFYGRPPPNGRPSRFQP